MKCQEENFVIVHFAHNQSCHTPTFNNDDEYAAAAISENITSYPTRLEEINNKIFVPFEINDNDSPLCETDPDVQIYSENHYIQSTSCDYYFEDDFNSKIGNACDSADKLSFFHMNIKSPPKHHNELEIYLGSLQVKFSFIGLSETWLDECKHDLYDIDGYSCVHRYRTTRKGGVTLAIKNEIPYMTRCDIEYFDSEMESPFIEIDKEVFGTSCNIVIGIKYRMPDYSVDIFSERMNDVLNIIQKECKICYILGDLNIDFLKYDEHRPTSTFLDVLYAYNVFPLISKPTRVTKSTATLIDHILTNNFDVSTNHKQGIICNDISDHYAIFHISEYKKAAESENYIVNRDMRHQNVVKFSEELKGIDWENVVNKQNAQEAYSIFHKIITEKYNLCFPIKKCRKRYYNKKPWLTSALKQSIKVKNKLYVWRNKGNDIEQKVAFYKTYRNRLNHILRSADRKYYQDLLIRHKSNTKKAWNVIKMVINKRKYRQCCTKFVTNGKIVGDGKLIANRFNDFSVNVGSSLAKTIPLSPKDPTDYMTQNINVIFNINPVTGDEITKIMGQFKDSAAGWDTLKPSVMKNIKEYVKYPLAHICNLSFLNGVFPKEVKLANVAPVFKANDEMIFTNYRPVSVLPVFSKLIERLMYSRLVSYINENHLLCKYQFGPRQVKAHTWLLLYLLKK